MKNIDDISQAVVLITAIASLANARKILPKVFELNPRQVIIPLNVI